MSDPKKCNQRKTLAPLQWDSDVGTFFQNPFIFTQRVSCVCNGLLNNKKLSRYLNVLTSWSYLAFEPAERVSQGQLSAAGPLEKSLHSRQIFVKIAFWLLKILPTHSFHTTIHIDSLSQLRALQGVINHDIHRVA